jgi:hypothetical protein
LEVAPRGPGLLVSSVLFPPGQDSNIFYFIF